MEDEASEEIEQLAWEDQTGEELPVHEVRKARHKEIGYINDKKVWRKITRREAIRRGIKIVAVRWIDINGEFCVPQMSITFISQRNQARHAH